jgi:hypothetical protein
MQDISTAAALTEVVFSAKTTVAVMHMVAAAMPIVDMSTPGTPTAATSTAATSIAVMLVTLMQAAAESAVMPALNGVVSATMAVAVATMAVADMAMDAGKK